MKWKLGQGKYLTLFHIEMNGSTIIDNTNMAIRTKTEAQAAIDLSKNIGLDYALILFPLLKLVSTETLCKMAENQANHGRSAPQRSKLHTYEP